MRLDHRQQKVIDAAERELKRARNTVALLIVFCGLVLAMGWQLKMLTVSNFPLMLAILVGPLAGLLFHVYRTLSATTHLLQEIVNADPQALSQQISRHLGDSGAESLHP